MLPICIMGEPVLHQPAAPVTDFSAISKLVQRMRSTMLAAPGVGLAAPQVGVGLQIFTYCYEGAEGVAVNPKLELGPLRREIPHPVDDLEGCLSFPGPSYPLLRAEEVVLHAYDQRGKAFTLSVSGWLARIFQHECDHLEGKLYVDRLLPGLRRRALRRARKEGWGEPGLTWLPDGEENRS